MRLESAVVILGVFLIHPTAATGGEPAQPREDAAPRRIVPPTDGKPGAGVVIVQRVQPPASDAAQAPTPPGALAAPQDDAELPRVFTYPRDDHRRPYTYVPGGRYDSPFDRPRHQYNPFYPWMLEDAYDAGRQDEHDRQQHAFNLGDMERRKARALSKHGQSLAAGLERMQAADYRRAVISLTLAAKLNQGDPACRIHLAQARLALGHYQEAALALRRALQLQPLLLYHDLNLERYFGQPGELDRYADTLRSWLEGRPDAAGPRFLLSYLEYQRGRFDRAHEAALTASTLSPKDELTRDLLAITKPVGD